MRKINEVLQNGKEMVQRKTYNVFYKAVTAINNERGEGFVDMLAKIFIILVLAVLILGGLYAMFDKTFMPMLQQRLIDLLNFAG